MGEILVGLFAVLVGAVFCFSGNVLMRLLFPLMGFFAGFSAGAAMIAGIGDDRFLGTVLGWVVGLGIGLLFALLAYFFYAFAVILTFASLGFSLMAGLLALLNLDWNWLVIILGTAAAVLFGIFALASNMPAIVLIVASSFLGSAIMIYGLMLVFNTAELGDFSSGKVRLIINNNLGLYILWLFGAISGSMAQARALSVETANMQQMWESSNSFNDFMVSSTAPKAKKK